MDNIMTKGFVELSQNEMEVVTGGDGLGLGDWLVEYWNMVGKALHDAFGCYKCGYHFF